MACLEALERKVLARLDDIERIVVEMREEDAAWRAEMRADRSVH